MSRRGPVAYLCKKDWSGNDFVGNKIHCVLFSESRSVRTVDALLLGYSLLFRAFVLDVSSSFTSLNQSYGGRCNAVVLCTLFLFLLNKFLQHSRHYTMPLPCLQSCILIFLSLWLHFTPNVHQQSWWKLVSGGQVPDRSHPLKATSSFLHIWAILR